MNYRRWVSMLLTVSLTTPMIYGLDRPTIDMGVDGQSAEITGVAVPNTAINIIIQKDGAYYYLDTLMTDETGNYEVIAKLPANEVFEAVISNEGKVVEVEIKTSKPPTESEKPENEGKPEEAPTQEYITFSVDKETLNEGYVLSPTQVEITSGETVWDVFQRVLDEEGISYDYNSSSTYDSVYIEAIDGVGEFDHGEGSGWMYSVNGYYPDYSSSLYDLTGGERVKWRYTTNYGEDLGENPEDHLEEDALEEDALEEETEEEVNDVVTEEELIGDALSEEERFEAVEHLINHLEGSTLYTDFDTISKWAQQDILRASLHGLMNGYEDQTFRPHQPVTRAEFVSILVRAIYGTEVKATKTTSFTDVKATDWFKDAVDLATEKGIASGYGDGTFLPHEPINREQMAVMLVRGLELMNQDSQDKQEKHILVREITDFDTVAPWAQEEVLVAYEQGLIKGVDNAFKPKDTVTREVAGVIALRAYNWLHDTEAQNVETTTQTKEEQVNQNQEAEQEEILAQEAKQEQEAVEKQEEIQVQEVVEQQEQVQQGETSSESEVTSQMSQEVVQVLDDTTNYLLQKVAKPQFGVIGGEWAVFGLARRGVEVPEQYYEDYYNHIQEVVQHEHNKSSRKWSTKVTETQRLAIAVAAIGQNPEDVAGVDLVDYSFNKGKYMSDLSEKDQMLGGRQGLNELVFGLITMDLQQTPQPSDAQITRQEIINTLINNYQTPTGAFSLQAGSTKGEVDVTAMAIQALAPYYHVEGYNHVKTSVDAALEYLKLSPQVLESSESLAQTIVALCTMGIDPATDTRFEKEGKDLITHLLEYSSEEGGFMHQKNQGVDQMATEQAYYALVAYERLVLGKSSLYDMMEG